MMSLGGDAGRSLAFNSMCRVLEGRLHQTLGGEVRCLDFVGCQCRTASVRNAPELEVWLSPQDDGCTGSVMRVPGQ